jgi:hypothetical protein
VINSRGEEWKMCQRGVSSNLNMYTLLNTVKMYLIELTVHCQCSLHHDYLIDTLRAALRMLHQTFYICLENIHSY